MKKQILPVAVLIATFMAMMAFMYPSERQFGNILNPPQDTVKSVFPADVQKILETSCFDCHSDAASNAKAKLKVNFSKWSELSDSKKVGKMQDISDIITKGDMPPAKYVTNYPDRAPGKEQKDIVIKWATEESDKLMGK